jgi:tetratricopeptide (TPR) repeat protein
MNFNALNELREQSQALHARRHQSASDQYQKGLSFFDQALASQFKDKKALKQAFELWISAMKTHRKNPSPSIGVGYIFMLLGDSINATRYFLNAQRIQPDNPDVALFLNALQTPTTKKSPSASAMDPDQLYEKIEKKIFSLRQWLRKEPKPEAVLNQIAVQKLLERRQRQSQDLVEIQTLIDKLEQFLDISLLNREFHALEKSLETIDRAISVSLVFSVIAQEIETALSTISNIFQNYHLNRNDALRQFEQILDLCDKLADQLDDIENQGNSITEIQALYNQMIERVSLLQENLDELA